MPAKRPLRLAASRRSTSPAVFATGEERARRSPPPQRRLQGRGTAKRWRGRIVLLAGACVLAFASAAQAHGPGALHLHAPDAPAGADAAGQRSWLAGDHHIHSRFSVDWEPDPAGGPPKPVLGGDSPYGIPINAEMARKHGLAWMVATDHGGPNHSKLSYEQAYPELLEARRAVPEVIQFYGMEFDTPGADHSSLIVPHTHDERERLREVESRFNKREPHPADPARDTEPKMLEALRHMKDMAAPPVVIANHPSRSAKGVGVYGLTTPTELRDWNDTAPRVSVGMEGAPGHQAGGLKADGTPDPEGARGSYRNAPTLGGFDQMTARVGGFWDSMLGEGRRWWVTATSDSHRHYTEGGNDFWPGEYAKTYVWAARTHADILDGLRSGRVFVTTGDLISELEVTAEAGGGRAAIGGTLETPKGRDVRVTIRLRDPAGANAAGGSPEVARVDLIVGKVQGPAADRAADANSTTLVVRRFGPADWRREGETLTMTHVLKGVAEDSYLRVRGTNGAELEPAPDPAGEDPWSDLWFYANPIFLEVR